LTEEAVFRSEVHSFFLRPFLDDAQAKLGREEMRVLLARFGVTEEQLRDETAWVSLRFCEDLFEALIGAGEDLGMFDRCGRLAVSPKYAGILRPLFRAVGDPLFAYRQVVQATVRFNKVGLWTMVDARRGFASLEYRPRPEAPFERGPYVCYARGAQLAALPLMFDVPPAEVDHPVCLHKGGAFCRYDLSWRYYGGRWASRLALLLGAPAGAVTFAALGGHHAAMAIGGALTSLAAWSIARARELRRQAAAQASDLADTNEALVVSARAHEERFAQLTEAKAEVERKVEERTTEIREVNQRLAATLDEVRSLEQAERNFFANISHDLRTPLTLILAPLDNLIVAAGLGAAERRSIETIRRNAEQLRRLIDQLLDVEKIQAGRTEIVRVPTDLRALVENVVEKFSGEAAKRNLRIDAAVGEPRSLAIDAAWIDSALMNLVANATRFARSTIRIRVREPGDDVVIEVEDDGPGIPRDELPHIFDRFVQAGTPRERRGGSGLGLAIAREAVRLHGGVLTVASEIGQGTVFTMTLPRGLGEAGSAGPGSPGAPLPRAPSAEIPALSLSAPQRRQKAWKGPAPDSPLVVVIEDDDELRIFIAETLAARYRVEVAADGEEGLALVRARRPEAVVSDIAMPKLDGTELCRRLRAAPETRTLPILLVTARRQVDRVLEGFEAGATDYIAKPFHPRELLARLESHLLARRVLHQMAHRERLVSLGVLAASVAHQVRNPLSALKNTVVSLQRRVTADALPSAPPMFALINECVDRIEKFTQDLLDLSRVERPDGGDFRPAAGIESAVRLLSTRLAAGVEVAVDLDAAVELTGKPGEMNYVFMNLIDNAIRAVGTSGRVEIRGGREGEDFVFEVADSGAGVPEDRRRWIFEPFATTRASDGTGLGLFIARKVVIDHGGDISVSTSNLGGALFRVRIPTAAAQRGLGPARGSAAAN
jgi:signal transduction histidine kinase